MSHAGDIRAWLSAQDGPRTVVEVADALRKPGLDEKAQEAQRMLTYHSCYRMWRDGILARTGKCREFKFSIARVVHVPFTVDERKRRAAECTRKRWARISPRTRAEYDAERAAGKAATLARRAAEKAQRKAEREKARAERQAEQKAARTAARATRATAPRKPRTPRVAPQNEAQRRKREVFDRAFVPKPPPQPARVESVDEFLRRGGRIERLQPGVCSHRDEWMEAA